jgi:hypothetical protein
MQPVILGQTPTQDARCHALGVEGLQRLHLLTSAHKLDGAPAHLQRKQTTRQAGERLARVSRQFAQTLVGPPAHLRQQQNRAARQSDSQATRQAHLLDAECRSSAAVSIHLGQHSSRDLHCSSSKGQTQQVQAGSGSRGRGQTLWQAAAGHSRPQQATAVHVL